jgi:hypothetical protein
VTPVPVLCRLRIRSLKHIFPKSASAYVLRLSFLQFYGGIDGLIYVYFLSLEFLLQQPLMRSGFRVGERSKEIDEARTDTLRVFCCIRLFQSQTRKVRFVVEVFRHEGSSCNREKEREVNTGGLGFAFERRQR